MIPSLPPELYQRLYNAVLDCDDFATDAALQALFADNRITSWAADLPEAVGDAVRVRESIRNLLKHKHNVSENGLIVFLRMLTAQYGDTNTQS